MTMEHKYKLSDPKALISDPDYLKYGPLALIGNVNDTYGRLLLLSDCRWPALATKLPQSNNASKSTGKPKCFKCQGPHLIKDCPKKGKSGSKDAPDAKKTKTDKDKDLPAWKHLEPKDLTKPLKDVDGREWKFCTKCKSKKSQKIGMYQLSHFNSEHIDNFARVSAPTYSARAAPGPVTREGNLASVADPSPIPSFFRQCSQQS